MLALVVMSHCHVRLATCLSQEKSSMDGKISNRRFLCFALITFLFILSGSGALFCDDSGGKEKGVRDTSTLRQEGENKMGTTTRLTEDEGKHLLMVARNTIRNRLDNIEEPQIDWKDLPEKFQERLGTFVTITTGGNLRGCIGHIIPREALIEGIRENAINAAFRDPRFPPLTKDEFDNIEIEVSILTVPQELSYADATDLLKKLRPGVDGVIIKMGFHEATFLPQVWDQLPDKEEFLSHLCLKAGLSYDSWRKGKLQVSTYQVQAFEEEKAK
jgi:AmmeMemoRadiSam system protein A